VDGINRLAGCVHEGNDVHARHNGRLGHFGGRSGANHYYALLRSRETDPCLHVVFKSEELLCLAKKYDLTPRVVTEHAEQLAFFLYSSLQVRYSMCELSFGERYTVSRLRSRVRSP
jgi:hypothetical protein